MGFELESQTIEVDFTSTSIYDLAIAGWIGYLFWFIVLMVILLLARLIFKEIVRRTRYFNHKVFLVRLSKEKPGDNEKEMNEYDIRPCFFHS